MTSEVPWASRIARHALPFPAGIRHRARATGMDGSAPYDPLEAPVNPSDPDAALARHGLVERIGEDVVAAEFVATEQALGALENAGGLVRDLCNIATEQWTLAIEDGWAAMTETLDVRRPADWFGVQVRFAERRLRHASHGARRSIDACVARLSDAGDTRGWRLVTRMLRDDVAGTATD